MVLMTYAQAAVLAVQREMSTDPRVVVMGEDVGRGGIFGQYKGLQDQFGRERVIDTSPASLTRRSTMSARTRSSARWALSASMASSGGSAER